MAKEKKKSFDMTQMSVKQITQAKDDIQLILASLEEQYRKSEISDNAYKETKEKNTKKLEEIMAFLIDMGMRDIADKPPKELEKKTQDTPSESPSTPGTPQSGTPPATPGTPQATVQVQAAPAVNMELIDMKIKSGLERVNTIVEAMKESEKSTDEKIQRITESLGEIRALIFGKEERKKDQAIRVERLEEEMAEVDPRKIEKQFAKRDKTLTELLVKADKLETKQEIMTKNMGDVQSTLRSIGNLENIASVNKDVMNKMREMNNISTLTNRLSDKVQKIFIDLNKKLELFMMYKNRQDSLDELSKEMMKTVDGISIKMEGFVEKKDIDALKNDIYSLGNKIGDVNKMIDVIIPIVNLKMPESIKQLQKKKESIEGVLLSLEDSYRDERITKQDYISAKEKNEKALKDIEKKLKREWTRTQEIAKSGKLTTEAKTEKKEIKPAEATEEKKEPKTQEQKEIKTKKAVIEKTKSVTGMPVLDEPEDEPKEEKPAEKTTEERADTIPEKKKPTVTVEPKKTETKKEAKPKPAKTENVDSATQTLIDELKDTLDKGLISKEAYEESKKMLLESME
ncbi:MAG: hypothetical protein ABIH52_04790 [Candidatus Aenigmatarchaeota archaeon]